MTLTQYLGDGKTHLIPLAWEGAPYDPTGAFLLWTAKDKAEDLDINARIQKASGLGITVVQDNGQWYAAVETVYADTGTMAPCRLVWDVQAQRSGESPRTVAAGTLTLIRDITREFTPSITIFTTQPAGPGNGAVAAGVASVNGRDGAVTLSAQDVGLGNVDNTADVDKPVSTAAALAIAAAENNARAASRAASWVPAWSEVTGKPATFLPSAHGHDWTDITGKPGFFSGSYLDLTNKPSLFSGAYADLTGKPSLFDGTWTSLTGKPALFDGAWSSLSGVPASFTPSAHTHTAAQISDSTATGRALIAAADDAAARTAIGAGTSSFSGAYSALSGIPSSFTPSAHSHAISDTTGLQTALDAKQAIVARITQLLALGEGYIKINPDGSLSVDIPAGGGGGIPSPADATEYLKPYVNRLSGQGFRNIHTQGIFSRGTYVNGTGAAITALTVGWDSWLAASTGTTATGAAADLFGMYASGGMGFFAQGVGTDNNPEYIDAGITFYIPTLSTGSESFYTFLLCAGTAREYGASDWRSGANWGLVVYSDNTLRVFRRVGGVFTLSAGSVTIAAYTRYRVRMVYKWGDTTIRGYCNGVEFGSVACPANPMTGGGTDSAPSGLTMIRIEKTLGTTSRTVNYRFQTLDISFPGL